MARRNGIVSGAEAGLYILLAVLVFVALWYFATVGKPALAAWLDQAGSNFAGGISEGLFNVSQESSSPLVRTAAENASGPVNDWLFGLTGFLGQWDLGVNPANLDPASGVTPQFGS